jgi:pimeloyl-ACP methyl ester carboxylesterase
MTRRRLIPLLALALLFTSARLWAEAPTAPTPSTFDSNGVKISYTVEGKGDPVLLIHGFAANGDFNWRAPGVIKALAEKYQVITIDNRGHGKSEKPHDTAKYGEEMAEDAIRLLDHLGIKKAHVVGYSMGGMITAKILTTHPDRLLSATLGGHGGLKQGDDVSRLDVLAESLDTGKGLGPLFIALTPKGKPPMPQQQIDEMNKRLLAINDPKALAAVVRSWKAMVVADDKLKANKVPTLVLIGELDPLKKGVDALEGRLTNYHVVVINGADHMDAMRKEQFVSELKSFLAANAAGQAASANGAATNGAATNGEAAKPRKKTETAPTKD